MCCMCPPAVNTANGSMAADEQDQNILRISEFLFEPYPFLSHAVVLTNPLSIAPIPLGMMPSAAPRHHLLLC